MSLSDAYKTVGFSTPSRDTAIKASTLLAGGFDAHTLATKNTKILIIGGSGKTMIVDAITRALSDDHSPYKMSADRFVEGAAFGSADVKALKKITHNNQDYNVALTHIFDEHALGLKLSLPNWIQAPLRLWRKPLHECLFFVSTFDESFIIDKSGNEIFEPDITIKFSDGPDEKSWDRDWNITVHNIALLTDKMIAALDNLENYAAQSQARRDRALDLTID